MTDQTNGKKMQVMTLRMPPEMYAEIRQLAIQDDRPMNTFVLRILKDYLKPLKTEPDQV